VLLGVAAFSGGCGGGDDDDTDRMGGYGTCDLRAVSGTCIETTASPQDIANQKAGCLDTGALWSVEPCPATPELVGCCEYTFGNEFRECFYEGSRHSDPVQYCATTVDGGVWTAAR